MIALLALTAYQPAPEETNFLQARVMEAVCQSAKPPSQGFLFIVGGRKGSTTQATIKPAPPSMQKRITFPFSETINFTQAKISLVKNSSNTAQVLLSSSETESPPSYFIFSPIGNGFIEKFVIKVSYKALTSEFQCLTFVEKPAVLK